jgi:hypothetical protein
LSRFARVGIINGTDGTIAFVVTTIVLLVESFVLRQNVVIIIFPARTKREWCRTRERGRFGPQCSTVGWGLDIAAEVINLFPHKAHPHDIVCGVEAHTVEFHAGGLQDG